MIRDGVRGFRMTVAGGLGPLPTEAKLLHEFIPAEEVVSRVEAVIRMFNRHGNRKNKNKARLKFVMRERGFDWLRDAIEEEYQDIVRNGGIADAGGSARKLRWFSAGTTTTRDAANCCRCSTQASPDLRAWRETNVQPQKQAGYSIVTVTVPQGNLTGDQMRGLAVLSEQAGDGSLRFSMNQNVVLAYVPAGALKRVYGRAGRTGLSRRGRRRDQRRHHLSRARIAATWR